MEMTSRSGCDLPKNGTAFERCRPSIRPTAIRWIRQSFQRMMIGDSYGGITRIDPQSPAFQQHIPEFFMEENDVR